MRDYWKALGIMALTVLAMVGAMALGVTRGSTQLHPAAQRPATPGRVVTVR
jgi:hypothetical protein